MNEAIRELHPQYEDREDKWSFFLQSYEGGYNYFSEENLFTHEREPYKNYKFRLDRIFDINLCEKVISVYTGYLFKKAPVRDYQGDEAFEEFESNVDLCETDINEFFQNISDLSKLFGHVGILIDKPRVNGDVVSKADDVLPYYTIVYPTNLIDWHTDEHNRYEWIRIKEKSNEKADPFQSRQNQTVYRTYTKNEWYIHNEDGDMIDRGEHNLGQVPYVTVYNRKLKRYPLFGWSLIEDIAYINRAIVNIASLILEFVYRQCFSQLVLPESAVPREEESQGEIVMGTDNAIVISDDTTVEPEYLTPPTEPMDFLRQYTQDLREAIYQLAKIEAPSFEPTEQSGKSKAWDFHQTNSSLATQAHFLQEAERKCAKIWHKWIDKEFDGYIEYPEEFDIQALNTELENALRIKMYNLPQSFQKEYDKALYRKILTKLPKDLMAEIDKDIESGMTQLNQVTEKEEETINRITQRLQTPGG